MGCPLTGKQMVTFNEDYILKKIIKTGMEKLGAKILVRAFTAVVGDAGTRCKGTKYPVTTGNSYTVATALEKQKGCRGYGYRF